MTAILTSGFSSSLTIASVLTKINHQPMFGFAWQEKRLKRQEVRTPALGTGGGWKRCGSVIPIGERGARCDGELKRERGRGVVAEVGGCPERGGAVVRDRLP